MHASFVNQGQTHVLVTLLIGDSCFLPVYTVEAGQRGAAGPGQGPSLQVILIFVWLQLIEIIICALRKKPGEKQLVGLYHSIQP